MTESGCILGSSEMCQFAVLAERGHNTKEVDDLCICTYSAEEVSYENNEYPLRTILTGM